MAAPGGEKVDVRGKTSPEPGKLELVRGNELCRTHYGSFRFAECQSSSLDVPFPTAGEAQVALRSLSPDREPRKGGISKGLSVSGSTLSVRWSADEARVLRVSVNSFLDHLSLVVETMQMFGPPFLSEASLWILDSESWILDFFHRTRVRHLEQVQSEVL